MSAEEVANLVPTINSELNEDAEYRGNREDQEDLLLTAQRYLNIFHQIHIFKKAKRQEFDRQLIEMPDKVRRILAMLPGGRVLLEHIEEIEENEGIADASIAALIEKPGKSDDKNNSLTYSPNAYAQNMVPAVINAPIEISGDFTNLLKETFNTYSQNLQQLSANIQKIAAQKNVSAGGQAVPMPDLKETISTLLKENAQQQTEVLKSFGQTLSQSIIDSKSEQPRSEVTDTIASLLKENAQQQNEMLKSLGNSLSQKVVDSSGEPIQINITDTITSLLKENAKQQNETLKSLGETLSQTILESKSGGGAQPEISETITSLLKENAQQQNEVLKTLGSTLSQTLTETQNKPADSNITETVATLLKENARQQTEVLKSFGETLSQAILQSQKELVSSLLQSQQQEQVIMSRIVERSETVAIKNGKPKYQNIAPAPETDILPLPVNAPRPAETIITVEHEADKPTDVDSFIQENLADETEKNIPDSILQTVEESTPQAIEESISQTTETSIPQAAEESARPEKKGILQTFGAKLSQTLNKSAEKAPKAEEKPVEAEVVVETKSDKIDDSSQSIEADAQSQTKSKKNKKKSETAKTEAKSPMDAIAAALTETPETAVADNTVSQDTSVGQKNEPMENSFEDSIDIDINELFAAAENFDNPSNTLSATIHADTSDDEAQPISLSNEDTDWSSAFTEPADAMNQIKSALNPTDSVSSNDSVPVSLSPEDDNAHDSLSQAFTNFADTAQVISSNVTDDSEWEYVDENGNPISADDADSEWEYVDENGNPISADAADGEWEYVDENGNPISADAADGEWEYVDENGNPISADDADGEWEYVDENGNVVNH